ncbi:unnamed protein product [Owenia fusiformis]|uniref:DRBM domain-containing protein n=1 Tax=Owenia fusiformis TaxID=6347 RepID=A0A8S4P3I9_OWEFU|nr:unnamed protein product [Owenia fusiformis]
MLVFHFRSKRQGFTEKVQQKTRWLLPNSLELCTKRGYTPSYDLIANEGPVHEPMFVFRVTCGEFKGSGKGTSKRHAKHAAAQSCLNKLLGLPNGTNVEEPVPAEATYNPAQTVDGLAGNPIGQLQELTQKRLWRPPIYEFTSEQGPPHAREFVCNIKLHTTIETGTGKSKKVAKRNAAELMLQRIKAGIPEPPPEEDGDDGPAFGAIKEGKRIPTLTPQASKQISGFYATLKNATGKNLLALQTRSLNSATNYCQLLQEIAEEQRFEVTYVDIQESSQTGQRQCLVQLSTMPVAVCHGVGPTSDDAHAQAAHNALQYLKIMTKKA